MRLLYLEKFNNSSQKYLPLVGNTRLILLVLVSYIGDFIGARRLDFYLIDILGVDI